MSESVAGDNVTDGGVVGNGVDGCLVTIVDEADDVDAERVENAGGRIRNGSFIGCDIDVDECLHSS